MSEFFVAGFIMVILLMAFVGLALGAAANKKNRG